MSAYKELNINELNHSYKPSEFDFQTTEEVTAVEELLGQEDAIDAIRRGIRIKSKGYNIYVCDEHIENIEDLLKCEIQKVAVKQSKPLAIGYLYNFNCPEEPLFIKMKVKDAATLQCDLEELQAFIKNDMLDLLQSKEVQQQQADIVRVFEVLKQEYIEQIKEKALKYNISAENIEERIKFEILDENQEPISKKEFLQLSQEQQQKITEDLYKVQQYSNDILDKLSTEEVRYLKMYDEVIEEVILKQIGSLIKRLINEYSHYALLEKYFNNIAENILINMQSFIAYYNYRLQQDSSIEALDTDENINRLLNNYNFNRLVVPCKKGVPIIMDYDHQELSLSGKILMNAESNALTSDYRYIRAGLFHYAYGGYLILHADRLIEKPNGWKILKEFIKTECIRIEGNEDIGIALTRSIKPEVIKAKIKIILIGTRSIYDALLAYDNEFSRLFKVKVEFKGEIPCDKEQITKLAGVIKSRCKKEKLLPVTTAALIKMIEIQTRKTDHVNVIPSNVELLMDLIREANEYATKQIEVADITKCLIAREKYIRSFERELDESIRNFNYLIETSGSRIGQINGLAVYTLEDISFGRPIKITVTTYRGREGIVDIENEAKLSGSIHTKGIRIISGFLGSQFATEFPITLSCNICFEQSYSSIDGDSASSAELYCILSSLSETPINQNLAVTGSVNQFGEIQPIGGVNDKIEGFYKVCKQKGLRGNEGVIIPSQNIKDLLLNEEVIEAVKYQKFHIYSICNIWDGVELLMGNKDKIISKVQSKLARYSK